PLSRDGLGPPRCCRGSRCGRRGRTGGPGRGRLVRACRWGADRAVLRAGRAGFRQRRVERPGDAGTIRRGGPAVSIALVPLAFLMWAVTYPSRALPMLAPGIERLP